MLPGVNRCSQPTSSANIKHAQPAVPCHMMRICLFCKLHSPDYRLGSHLNQRLVCTGFAGTMPGNPTFFASMVHFLGRGHLQLSDPQQQHVINSVCQGAILMETEAAADQYREALVSHRANCPHLVCKDTGSLIRAGGSIRIGKGATAPESIHGMGLCLAAPPMQVTEAYRRCKSVLTALASMEQLIQRCPKPRCVELFSPGGKVTLLCCFASCDAVRERLEYVFHLVQQ